MAQGFWLKDHAHCSWLMAMGASPALQPGRAPASDLVGVGMLMVLWFSGFLVLWFYGFIVLWLYGFVVLWFYGFMAFWFYSFMVL